MLCDIKATDECLMCVSGYYMTRLGKCEKIGGGGGEVVTPIGEGEYLRMVFLLVHVILGLDL